MNFYEDPPVSRGEIALQQGDILEGIPFLALAPAQVEVLEPESETTSIRDLTADQSWKDGTKLCVDCEISNAIVMSQTCDLGKTPYFLVARVVPWTTVLKATDMATERACRGKIRQLANPGRHSGVFYLPDHQLSDFVFPKSLAVLHSIQALDRIDLEAVQQARFRLRLSSIALQAFQERMSYFFGRFGAPDHLYYTREEWYAMKINSE